MHANNARILSPELLSPSMQTLISSLFVSAVVTLQKTAAASDVLQPSEAEVGRGNILG